MSVGSFVVMLVVVWATNLGRGQGGLLVNLLPGEMMSRANKPEALQYRFEEFGFSDELLVPMNSDDTVA
jgi:hypothetical protein